MPIYEYKCLDCGLRFDALRSMKDADSVIACKACQSEQTTRKVSVFYANSGGRVVAGGGCGGGGCGGCTGGSCSSCGH
jgi:putative FmdB family regulatory protein